MRTATAAEVSGRLEEYLAGLGEEPLVIVREGAPAALVVLLEPGEDPESVALSMSPRFRRLLERSDARGEALPEEEFWARVQATDEETP